MPSGFKKKNFRKKKTHKILIFFKKIRLFVFQKAEREIQKGFVPLRKKNVYIHYKIIILIILFFFFLL